MLEGALPGSGFGLAVGLLWTLAYPGSSSLLVFGMALAGFLVGIVSQYALNQNFLGCLICSAAVLAVQEVVRLLAGLFTQIAPIQSLLQVAVPGVPLVSVLDALGLSHLPIHLPPGGGTCLA